FDLVNEGTFYAAANSSLNMTEGFVQLDHGSLFTGPGITRLIDGYLGGSGTVVIDHTVELAGSHFAGHHTITGTGILNWTKGGFGPYGETSLTSNFTVHAHPSEAGLDLDLHTLSNAGTIHWNSDGFLHSTQSTFNNTGRLILGAECVLNGSGELYNSGIIASAENTTASLNPDWDWYLNHSGTFFAGTNSILNLIGDGFFVLDDGTTFEGPGLIRLSGAFEGMGTVNINSEVQLDGGMISGTHTFQGSGKLQWISGGFRAYGISTIDSSLEVDATSAGQKLLDNHTLINQSTISWGGTLEGEGELINEGLFLIENDWVAEGFGSFENTGRVEQKSGTATIRLHSVNHGTLVMTGGHLTFDDFYISAPTSIHEFVINGVNAGSDYGQIHATSLHPGGQLVFTAGSGLSGTELMANLAIFTHNHREGVFESVQVPNTTWSLKYQDSAIVLSIGDLAAPEIVTAPQSQSVNVADTATFHVEASGSELSYYWHFNGSAIPGANTSVLVLTNVQSSAAGVYSVVISNKTGWVSAEATLTVLAAPFILAQPANVTADLGAQATFSVEAGGDNPLTYQWFFKNSSIAGATDSLFTRPKITASQAGDYSVIVSNSVGAITSQVATLTINLSEDPFSQAAGAYHGLFYETDGIRLESAGYLTIKVKTNAGYSGKMLLDGNSISFSGKFPAEGITNRIVARTKFGKAPLLLNLQLDFGADRIIGSVVSSNWIAPLLADQVSNTNHANVSGKYTLLLPGSDDRDNAPTGYGYAAVTIRTNHKVSLSGLLADNHKAKQSSFVSKQGHWPFFMQAYVGTSVVAEGANWRTNRDYKGAVIGWLTVESEPEPSLTGAVSWIKNGWTNEFYKDGFTHQTNIIASYYLPPVKGTRALEMTNGTLSFSAGDLPAVQTNEVTLLPNNSFQTSSKTNLKMSIAAATGLIKGNFTHPGFETLVPFKGAVLQKQGFGAGFFMGTNEAGSMFLAPR
ncbi:MAG: immunoglobulin domain-containing protein, partial [Limisphaerales bacterium]